jgi:signal transduction histidine kinase
MKPMAHRILLVFISLAIVATIGLQWHWNLKNYEQNKQRLINDIQIALDNGIENYYAETAKKDIMIFLTDSAMPKKFKIFIQNQPPSAKAFPDPFEKSNLYKKNRELRVISRINRSVPIARDQTNFTDEQRRDFRQFNQQLVSSMSRGDSIDFKSLDSMVVKELKRKNIVLTHDYFFKKFSGRKVIYPSNGKITDTIAIAPKFTYLVRGDDFQFRFENPVSLIFSKGMTEIILSLILTLIVIGCLLYLLYIINRQKKIEEMRNDLISNITHEFKTPITTVVAALEGIRSFNEKDDKEKTSRYLDISERQMGKLQTMVEKLLETATLETDEIALKRERLDVVALLHAVVEKYQLYAGSKVTMTADPKREIFINGDAFHLENALSNLVDNAIKYGGEKTNIRVVEQQDWLEIFVEDDGGGIHGWHRERIFDKFYRIPKGNIHDVKGFGIGLFYSRKIVEKHDGTLTLVPDDHWTIFKITLPYA